MLKVNFNLRDANADSTTPVNMVLRWEKKRLVFPSGENIHPDFWDRDKQRAKSTKKFPSHPEFNERLADLENNANKVFRDFINDNKTSPSIEDLRKALKISITGENKPEQTDLMKFIEVFRNEAKTKVNPRSNKLLADKTLTSYKQLHEILIQYNRTKKRPVNFEDIDSDFYKDFTAFMFNSCGFLTNTVGKHIRTLKTILNEATERGINLNLRFRSKSFKAFAVETDSVYLDENELKELFNLDLKGNKTLSSVRDLFLIGCYTGLRFSDFSKLNPSNIKGDLITIEIQKTGQKIAVPIHPIVAEILNKYSDLHPMGKVIPKTYSNQKMNQYIKEICKKAKTLQKAVEIKENKAGMNVFKKFQKFELVSTHTARRSFATNQFKSGLDSKIIMAVTGHKTERSFLKYIKVTPEENANLMKLHWDRMENKKLG